MKANKSLAAASVSEGVIPSRLAPPPRPATGKSGRVPGSGYFPAWAAGMVASVPPAGSAPWYTAGNEADTSPT